MKSKILVQNNQKLKSLNIGAKALLKSRIHPDLALTIANIQEATGLAMIFQAKIQQIDNLSHTEYVYNAFKNWKILGRAQPNLPEFAFQEYDFWGMQLNAVHQYDLLIASERLLRFLKEEISLKDRKYRTYYEKAVLKLEMDHICTNYDILNKNTLTPEQFLRETIASFLMRTDMNFHIPFESLLKPTNNYDFNYQGPWLLITRGMHGEPLYIYGENQKQLTSYLTHSDYLDYYQISVPPSVDMSLGWNKIIEKQIGLSQQVCTDTLYRFKQFQEINQLNENYIKNSNIVQSQKIVKLKAQKSKLESLSMIVASSRANSLYEKIFVINKAYKREINKISYKIAEIEKNSDNFIMETQELESEINQKISQLINTYPSHQQLIPNDFLFHYFRPIEENILNPTENNASLTDLQLSNISILMDAAQVLRPEIPEIVLQTYLQKIDSKLQQDDLSAVFAKFSQAQDHINSDVLSQWIVEKYMILNPPKAVDKKVSIQEDVQMNDIQQKAKDENAIEKKLFSEIIFKPIVAVKNSFKTIVLKASERIDEIEKQKNDMQDIV